MSFGFSVGDFLAIANLIEATRKRFKGAPGEYLALANDTRTLQVVVSDLKVQIEDEELADPIKQDLQSALKSCDSVLTDLNAVIDTHTELGSTTLASRKLSPRIWKRVRWDPEEANKLRSRLISSTQLLEAVHRRIHSAHQRDIVQTLEKLTISHDSDEHQRIADWLAPGSHAEYQYDYFTKVQPGTGQWIFTDPTYLNWLNGDNSTLLLPGIPGAGKTFVASLINNDLQRYVSQDGTAALAFFYNSFRRFATQSRLHIISSMVRQLYMPQTADIVKGVYAKHNKCTPATRPDLEEMASTLESVLSEFSRAFFVIDALDEGQGPEPSDNRPWNYVLALLFRMQEKLKSKVAVKVVATSRPNLESKIDDLFVKGEQLTVHAKDYDLGTFCDALIPNIRCVAKKTELHPRIKDAIRESAGGMFLLAKLHCDTLAAKTKPRDVLQALKDFNQGSDALDQAYRETMQRIQSQPEEHRELAKRVLICIMYSARPLTLEEVRHALAVNEKTHDLDPEYDLDDPDDMISSCAGLVTVDSESKTIRLVHYTTQGFLESLGNQLMPDPHDFLASCCLNYLHMDAFADGHPKRIARFPFLEYSAEYWNWHMSSGSLVMPLRDRAFSFLHSIGSVTTVLGVLRGRSHFTSNIHGQCALHLLAYMGLNDWIRDYVAHGRPTDRDVDYCVSCPDCRILATENTRRLRETAGSWGKELTGWRDSLECTALWYAIEQNHTSTVKLLIELNNEILNDEDIEGDTPLMLALWKFKDEAIALSILQAPEMVLWSQYRTSRGWTYLHAAGIWGHQAVVERLLELASALNTSEARKVRDFFTTTLDFAGKSLLHHVAEGSSLEIFKRLLAYNGDSGLNVPGHSGRTPLHEAALNGNLDVVQYLMSRENIGSDLRDLNGSSALHLAAGHGSMSVLKYLLSTGVFPADSTDPSGRTALSYAAKAGDKEAVLFLTSREDVEVDRTDNNGMTALMHATQECSDAVACLAPLVTDINLPDISGNTALHHLARNTPWVFQVDMSFQSCLESLLKSGAALNLTNDQNETAYDALCRRVRNFTEFYEISDAGSDSLDPEQALEKLDFIFAPVEVLKKRKSIIGSCMKNSKRG